MKNPDDVLLSPRLICQRFTVDDVDLLEALYSDPDVARHVGGLLDPAQVRALMAERILGYYDEHPGLGIWLTRERQSGERVGMHLLNHIRGEELIQVGFVLSQAYWGRGYATEMAREVMRYGHVVLELPKIVGITNQPNEPSQSVLLKIGLQRVGERSFSHPVYAGDGPLAYFESDATQWRSFFRC